MTSFAKLATVTASTKRSAGVADGIEVGYAENIASLTCLPLDPVSPEIAQGVEGLSFRELLQTSCDGGLDIVEGDILVVDGTEYPIRAVGEWYWTPDKTNHLLLLLEDESVEAAAPSVDHGLLLGLDDDDHTIYLLADGTRDLTGNLAVDAGITIDGIDVGAHLHTGGAGDGGQLDHGAALAGLDDNDHNQYLLTNASNDPVTGNLVIQPANSIAAFKVNRADTTNVLTVDTLNARVGIGTVYPADKLHVYWDEDTWKGAIFSNVNAGSKTQTLLQVRNNTSVKDALRFGVLGRNFTTVGSYRQDGGVVSSDENLSGGLAFISRHTVGGIITFTTGGHDVEKMRITIGGNVGIGTVEPDDLLHIYGGDSGGTPDSLARLIIEDDTHAFINILTPDNTYSGLYLGSATEKKGALVAWNYNLALMRIGTTVAGHEVAIESGNSVEAVRIDNSGNVGIGTISPGARLHVDQPAAGGAIPVLLLDQADVDQEMVEFVCTIGVGNAIEAAGGKMLTATHFIKVTLPGGLTRYIPVGTIA